MSCRPPSEIIDNHYQRPRECFEELAGYIGADAAIKVESVKSLGITHLLKLTLDSATHTAVKHWQQCVLLRKGDLLG